MPRADATLMRIESGGSLVSHLRGIGTVPGVQVTTVGGRNGVGKGALRYNSSGLSWRAPQSVAFGTPVNVAAGGLFFLTDGADADKWVQVLVTAAYLPTTYLAAEVCLSDYFNNAVAPADHTEGGAAAEWSFSLKNYTAGTITGITAWLDADTPENRECEIKWTAGGTYSQPWYEAQALTVFGSNSLAAGASAAIYVRRNTIGTRSAVRSVRVHISWDDTAGGRGYQEARGSYRVAASAGDVEIYVSSSGRDPEPGSDAPIATPASLPNTPASTFGNGSHRVIAAVRNKYGLRSTSQRARLVTVASGSHTTNPPSGPDRMRMQPRAGGLVRVQSQYLAPRSSTETLATTWALWWTNTGVAPVLTNPPNAETAMSYLGDVATLDYFSIPAQSHGVTLIVAIKTKAGSMFSDEYIQQSLVINTNSSSAPLGGDRVVD